VSVGNAIDIATWLMACRYSDDRTFLDEPDHWQHPQTFEIVRCGDCEDFSLWAWRKFIEASFDADFVVGNRRTADGSIGRHAWVVYRERGDEFVFDSVERSLARIIRVRALAADEYEPQVGVDARSPVCVCRSVSHNMGSADEPRPTRLLNEGGTAMTLLVQRRTSVVGGPPHRENADRRPRMRHRFLAWAIIFPLALTACLSPQTAAAPSKQPLPRTRAERTRYSETSTHADVVAFLDSLQGVGVPMRLGSIGTTGEGRSIPYVVASRPLLDSPESAHGSGRPIVYVQGNIHGGEVEEGGTAGVAPRPAHRSGA
jgi:hypothetical protein